MEAILALIGVVVVALVGLVVAIKKKLGGGKTADEKLTTKVTLAKEAIAEQAAKAEEKITEVQTQADSGAAAAAAAAATISEKAEASKAEQATLATNAGFKKRG
jgi:hypothetical protein